MTVTNDDIKRLRQDMQDAGNAAVVHLCCKALGEDVPQIDITKEQARDTCAKIIAANQENKEKQE